MPKFGVWDEQSAAAAAQGFTVQFERVKRDRDVARAGGMPEVPRPPPPPEPRRSHRDSPFFSKVYVDALCNIRANFLLFFLILLVDISCNLLCADVWVLPPHGQILTDHELGYATFCHGIGQGLHLPCFVPSD